MDVMRKPRDVQLRTHPFDKASDDSDGENQLQLAVTRL